MGKRTSIKDWAEDDRPREKLLAKGARALSLAELLAILVGSGNAEEDAVELMRRVLADCGGSLKKLGRMSPEELSGNYLGIGTAKAVTILAACELSRRRQEEEAKELTTIRNSRDIYEYFLPELQDNHLEECHVLLLNQANRVIESRLISRGGIARAVVDVREVLRLALLAHATAMVLCHNHPSGNRKPSPDDDRLTEKLRQAAKTMDITLLDHLIFVDGAYYSYSDSGKL
ncbi:MAG: DNA repair protein RadC [Prevotellaceae bacterium]|nr:DNA repair protein RadC [Prevotellaceae bacterium]